jgi:hypothetical protein
MPRTWDDTTESLLQRQVGLANGLPVIKSRFVERPTSIYFLMEMKRGVPGPHAWVIPWEWTTFRLRLFEDAQARTRPITSWQDSPLRISELRPGALRMRLSPGTGGTTRPPTPSGSSSPTFPAQAACWCTVQAGRLSRCGRHG